MTANSEFNSTDLHDLTAALICCSLLQSHTAQVQQGSANFLGSRARWAPDEFAAGRTGKFYVKIKQVG